jgi:thiamine transport system ATP-binding protein
MKVQLIDIAAAFDGRYLYEHLFLSVESEEIVSLVGPSGSGKSTLLRIIAGIESPKWGRVILGDRDMTATPIHRRGVAMVFQDNQLFPHLDVARNIGYGLRGGAEWNARRVDETLELIGLAGFATRRIDTLSGGEAKRVALARSLAVQPKVLLLDEPLTGLDAALHSRLLADIGDVLRACRTTVVHVTHDTNEARALSHRIVDIESLDVRPTTGDSVTGSEG